MRCLADETLPCIWRLKIYSVEKKLWADAENSTILIGWVFGRMQLYKIIMIIEYSIPNYTTLYFKSTNKGNSEMGKNTVLWNIDCWPPKLNLWPAVDPPTKCDIFKACLRYCVHKTGGSGDLSPKNMPQTHPIWNQLLELQRSPGIPKIWNS